MRFVFYTNNFDEASVKPAKLAIAGSDGDLSWGELQQVVEKYCELFAQLNIPKGHPVILRGHKEAYFMAAMLAAVKCEIPYIPLDNIVPFERVKKIKEITGSQVLIYFGEKNIDLDLAIEINGELNVKKNASPKYSDENIFWFPEDPLFYIMFTSGSTGEPKGVQITRAAVCSYLEWMERDYGFSNEDIFINQAPFSFDLSVYEVMFSLHLGGSIILNENAIAKSTLLFVDRIKKFKGSVWISTPSFAYLFFLEPTFNAKNLPEIKTFLFCGEELPNRTAKKLLELFPGARVLNSYGPTEATVSTTLVSIDEKMIKEDPILPVGFPKNTCEILILNEENDTTQPGEIIIAGDNVSIGYLKDPELNAEKFYLHKGKRAYRTGDFGYIKNGMLYFNGRKDEQVKLNGYRIELGDINAQICKLDFVDDAVTVPFRIGLTVKKIVSFVKLKNVSNEAVSKKKIKERLIKYLPEYMVPGDIKILKDFPHSSNHKIDKKKLIEIYMDL